MFIAADLFFLLFWLTRMTGSPIGKSFAVWVLSACVMSCYTSSWVRVPILSALSQAVNWPSFPRPGRSHGLVALPTGFEIPFPPKRTHLHQPHLGEPVTFPFRLSLPTTNAKDDTHPNSRPTISPSSPTPSSDSAGSSTCPRPDQCRTCALGSLPCSRRSDGFNGIFSVSRTSTSETQTSTASRARCPCRTRSTPPNCRRTTAGTRTTRWSPDHPRRAR